MIHLTRGCAVYVLVRAGARAGAWVIDLPAARDRRRVGVFVPDTVHLGSAHNKTKCPLKASRSRTALCPESPPSRTCPKIGEKIKYREKYLLTYINAVTDTKSINNKRCLNRSTDMLVSRCWILVALTLT